MTTCTHDDRPSVLSLPSMGNPRMCRECWDKIAPTFRPQRFVQDWERGSDWKLVGQDYYYAGSYSSTIPSKGERERS